MTDHIQQNQALEDLQHSLIMEDEALRVNAEQRLHEEYPADNQLLITQPGVCLGDYRRAVAGEGDLGVDWTDKPHRLVYDLINEVKALNKELEEAKLEIERHHRDLALVSKLAEAIDDFLQNHIDEDLFYDPELLHFVRSAARQIRNTVG